VQYVRHRPAPPLDQFVEYLWSLSDAPAHAWELVVPSGTVELVINLVEDEIRVYRVSGMGQPDRHAGSVVSGAFARWFVIDTREHASIVGVHFRPGGAAPFLSVPADELGDRHVALESLWSPGEVMRLRDRLCSAPGPPAAARLQILEKELLGHLRRPLERQGMVRVALDWMEPANTSVRDVASALGISHRRLIEIFGLEVGMTPKQFLRVRRFQDVLAAAGRTAAPHWSHLAPMCGYFDQSHLIRDFQAFAGLTPAQYLLARSERVKDNHIPLLSEGQRRGQIFPRHGPVGRTGSREDDEETHTLPKSPGSGPLRSGARDRRMHDNQLIE
jgi:AraC-like DNA-binding protein